MPSGAVAATAVRARPDPAGKPSRAVAATAVRAPPDPAGERVLPSGSIGGKDWQPTALTAGTWGVPSEESMPTRTPLTRENTCTTCIT
jgi:hypothetical protein